MSTHKYIDRVCALALLFAIAITAVFMNGNALGVLALSGRAGYVNRLFDTSQVHTIDIVMEDWEDFIGNCENEEYEQCTVVIDGEVCKDAGIRAKGNTSLSSVSAMGSERYSFKIEFDHYDRTKNYFGLDKLNLNNLIQDTTFMKDYLTYRMMGSFGVDAPLCSYAYITVNGSDWGLYLAVEGVEEAFLQRSYGNDYGKLYKPDSMDMGAGPGNGRKFRMDEFTDFSGQEEAGAIPEKPEAAKPPEGMGDFREFSKAPFAGMGSSDVKLQYLGDDPESYPNIFENAKTDIGKADKKRLISSLKTLSEGGAEQAVDVDEVIRYFVVHNFVCNGDSYTGSIVHNYYLYEEDGRLSMIPWDYNLAFGTFQASDATAMVNSPIDSPVSEAAGGFPGSGPGQEQGRNGQEKEPDMDMADREDSRPMVDWIFEQEAYTRQYHQYFGDFLESVDFDEIIDTAAGLIAPYVEKDPTKFYTCEEFETGVAALREFCSLRRESVEGQLSGRIAADSAGQAAEGAALIDASHLDLSDMGTMERAEGGGGKGKYFAVSADILYNDDKMQELKGEGEHDFTE